jgi:apolipoprotein N-acyltransferase
MGLTGRYNLWLRYGLAALAGLLQALAFPKTGVAGLAWIAPGLLLLAGLGARPGEAFRCGYVAGLAFNLTSLYWLLFIPVRLAPIAGWLALSGYLAVYPALWTWLCWAIYPQSLREEMSGVAARIDRFLDTRVVPRMGWAFSCAVVWVAGEMVLARLWSGFPWSLLGVSQYRMLPVIQMASLTGVYGVSFLVVWMSVALLCAGLVLVRQPVAKRLWSVELLLPVVALMGVISFGWRQLVQPREEGGSLRVLLVQPSIPQQVIWNADEGPARFRQLTELAQRALSQERPDLMVWPEAAVPSLFRYDTNIHGPVVDLVRSNRVWLILGADDIKPPVEAARALEPQYFNGSFLLTPDGALAGAYHKRRLVIFGEYVPLGRWLPWLRQLAANTGGDFTPGRAPGQFVMPALRAKATILICFEDVFPHVARREVEDDTDFLLNLTNNGWFGESAAQWQHAANAVFRAVETDRPLVRCANNGLTCWVDARGRMNEVYFPGTQDIYGRGWKTADVPRLAGPGRPATVYRRYGDWFGWACVALTMAHLARVLVRARTSTTSPRSPQP